MNNGLKVFVLSLPKELDRRKSVTKQCKGYHLDFEFINAIDASSLTTENIESCYQPTEKAKKKRKILNKAEIACALGHQQIYQKIINEQIPYALILEDDFKFIESPVYLLDHLDNIQKRTQFDVLILGYVKMLEKDLSYQYRRLPLKVLDYFENYTIGRLWQQFSCGTVGYVITLEAAKKLHSSIIQTTADDWLFFEKVRFAKILHCRPLLILEKIDTFPSSIRTEKDNFLKIKRSSYLIRSTKGIIKYFLMNYMGLK